MLYTVVMAGGSGTRFWPKSRRQRPKQLISLYGQRTMLQQTINRIGPLMPWSQILVVTGADQATATAEQLPELPPENLIQEPCARDTAACVGLAAAVLAHRDPDAQMLLLPADHVIEPAEAFRRSIRAGLSLIQGQPEALVTFGVRPTRPETGYGYIERGEALEPIDGIAAYQVARFREKPDRATAEEFLNTGRFAWNAGIFLWSARTILLELAKHQPKLHDGLIRIAQAQASGPETFAKTLQEVFPTLDRLPIDKAVLEHSQAVRMLEVIFDWNDVGDWRALASLLETDATNNAVQGPVHLVETRNSIVVADEDRLIATLGLDNLVVIQSGGATLVAHRDHLDRLKTLVNGLAEAGFADTL